MIKVNWEACKKELNLVIEHIKELKHRRCQSGQPNWAARDMRELDILKDNATIWCMILAHRHGRVHMKGSTLEAQGIELEKTWNRNQVLWQQYFRFEDPVPVTPTAEYADQRPAG